MGALDLIFKPGPDEDRNISQEQGGEAPRDGGSSWKKKAVCVRVRVLMVVGSFCSKASLPSPLAYQPTRPAF